MLLCQLLRRLPTAALALLICCATVVDSTCGGYYSGVASGASYTIYSPNYPTSNYDRNTNCVWLFAANNFTELRVNVSFMQLETNADGSCKDFVQIREGNSSATELGTLCSSSSARRLVTSSRYLWIQFRSDYQVQDRGFSLTVTAAVNYAANRTDSPVRSCQLTQYTCPNMECIYTSYLCDSVNDCGCEDYGCDETKCWTFSHLNSIGFNWGVGVGIGFFIGLVLLIAFGLHEMPQHKRPECLRRRDRSLGGGAGDESSRCLLACAQRCRRNKVDQRKPGDEFKSMLERMSANRHPLRWETESESDAGRSGGPSRSGSITGSRRSSYQMSVSAASYGNTLSPRDIPTSAPKPAPSPASAAKAATLTVPGSSAV